MLTDEHFQLICSWIEAKIGLSLGPEKRYLVEHRLEPVAKMNNFANLNTLIDATVKGSDELLRQQVVDSLVTNETYFFRDPEAYEEIKLIVTKLYKTKTDKVLRIWSAACSSGQELYSLAIVLHELNLDWTGWELQFIGTDISDAMLLKAKLGVYNHFEVQRGLQITQLLKWFTQVDGGWKINPPFAKNFSFKMMNLLDKTLAVNKIDVVFLRNVLIYFDSSVKKQLLMKMRTILNENGLLFLGGTETAFYLSDELVRLKEFKTPVYQFKNHSNNGRFLSELNEDAQSDLKKIKWPSL